ncbi:MULTISPECIES: magnesium transporter [Pseudothermotoga]|jgi:magnesium transporter|uniref:Magnesium transporter MgtE n=1 Tax=Pseudothermotoga lettingae (strain ATCC BAA-301 / DSM 14385 / NBRC 107922 / TMO) TaxID=416591 RepID=A8F707_PSELT|nr:MULTISPECIES: magnesium transporter [Pseudothermotoga]ABV33941.1 magnesium transporter [Pseudothermotoga lettingae TMO]KUK20023.1 MAG: Magnesium transporter [Pseudothermotoga lettingae]MDI3494626.1 magnesium transporter [Pseudothermotoga sp.]MDK2884226.1 magnesium transporter [Pseudothermotoga sp.]GLI49122.1 magnesium transporter MgtE [Pseudothermotoga lettingae TMO]
MKVKVQVDIKKLIENGDFRTLKTILSQQEPAEILELIEELPADEKIIVFRFLSKDQAAVVFSELETDDQMELIELFKEERLSEIISSMDPDDRAELLEEMPANVVNKLLSFLTPEERKLTLSLLNYPENSAGRLTTPKCLELNPNMTVSEALEKIRKEGKDKETVHLMPVIDKSRILLGTVELQDLIFSEPDLYVEQIMDSEPVFVYATTDQEEVAQIMKKYDLIAIPVVDSEQRLIGIITIDDIVDVIDEEATEDIQKMSSIVTTEQPYLHLSGWKLIFKRLPWLIALLLMESINGNVIAKFEHFLASLPIVAAFMPTMMDTGGNIGSQISALVIRGMALGDIKLKDWWKVLLRETAIGLVLGAVLGIVLFFRSMMISQALEIGLAVSVALMVVVIFANALGAALPFLARLIKIDPAIMAGPLLTTIVDVSGIIMYFMIVHWILR